MNFKVFWDYIYLVFILFFTVHRATSVQIRKFYVPAKAANEAPLLCNYDLDSQQLYDVKWYKDGLQFFRCLPGGETIVYEVEGVTVQFIKFMPSGSCSPTLMMLSPKSGGEYKCEVNTEGPKFDTVSMSKNLKIIEYQRKTQPTTVIVSQSTEVARVQEFNTTQKGNEAYRFSKGINILSDLSLLIFTLSATFVNCLLKTSI